MEYKRLPFQQYFIDLPKGTKLSQKLTSNKPCDKSIVYTHIKSKSHLFGPFYLNISCEFNIRYLADRNVIQINFEETNGFADWIINALIKEEYYGTFQIENFGDINLKASKGWLDTWLAMKHTVRRCFKEELNRHPDAYVEIVGWSLASAVACYCAQDLNYNYGVKPYLYTYGSVLCWYSDEKDKCQAYLQSCCADAFNFGFYNDVTSYLPCFPKFFTTNPIKLGKFNPLQLFLFLKWHFTYWKDDIYG